MNELFSTSRPIVVSCSPKIVPWLKQELMTLGYQAEGETETTIQTKGTFNDAVRLNLSLRTANHVYLLIEQFVADTVSQLYQELKKIPWEKIIPIDGYFSVHSVADHPEIENTMFLNVKVKDAIADRFQSVRGKRPDSGPEKNRVVIFLFWKENNAFVYLDTSGESLSKHGYRKISLRAPLQESLAAAMILSTHWDKASAFVNPMCGSGTLAIEAALIRTNKAPGLIRQNYSFMHVTGFNPADLNQIRQQLTNEISQDSSGKIVATDIDLRAIEAARENAKNAGVENLIEFARCTFDNTPIPDSKGVVIINPPYGERIGSSTQLENTYTSIGDFLKNRCSGYWGYVLSGNPELSGKIGLRPKRKIDFYNAQLKCKLLEFELYQGSKKKKHLSANA